MKATTMARDVIARLYSGQGRVASVLLFGVRCALVLPGAARSHSELRTKAHSTPNRSTGHRSALRERLDQLHLPGVIDSVTRDPNQQAKPLVLGQNRPIAGDSGQFLLHRLDDVDDLLPGHGLLVVDHEPVIALQHEWLELRA